MSGAYRFETWDVFTKERFAGNPLAVVFDADELSTQEMLRIAKEFNLSETVFIRQAENTGHLAALRIFTPAYEMPFAGHPTVGAAIAVARSKAVSGDRMLELPAGLFPVNVSVAGVSGRASFVNPNLPTEGATAPEASLIAAAVGLQPGDIDGEQWRPRIFSAGAPFLYARTSSDALRNAKLDLTAFEKMGIDDVVGLYLYAEEYEDGVSDYRVRMFAPNAGLIEDPATGSAAAALPGHLILGGGLSDGETTLSVRQGVEMGRPSEISVVVLVENGAVSRVEIAGNAILVQEGVFFP